ncbi:carnitine dehydratase [Prauserella marina]|uniref:Alpha-methylacyl-CoA racemase n=1 Tax=Prauserella marina TaxID=530584 RepID=A0A222VV47_9PSEU|nr:CaiB/BaiF CoA-transferase family protein [Prauserella marina]ASR37702.1 carnitine dehydratase [Prauserella marina]PWV75632.1 alpha-methylacyl-CoA racemase [Prauserella marina]SDD30096.1 alpha-methylacyl-CoA racemase [Prauserella marina]
MAGNGPLAGVKVVELAGMGPAPFAAMLLADMGAQVIRLERRVASDAGAGAWNHLHRGRPSVACDLGTAEGTELALRLTETADILLEGFRPGVLERLGLGPDRLLASNPALVYGRATGYGQTGPLSTVAGHDINYIAVAGALGAIRRQGETPLFPLSLVGDFGGGGMLLAFGVLCGLVEARRSGKGQVVDAAMVEGTALLTTIFHALRDAGEWDGEPGTNTLDSGAHFYEVYPASDGGHVAVGALEPQFYAELLRLLELDPADYPQWERARWPELKKKLGEIFRSRPTDEWAGLFENEQACVTAVYGLDDAPSHPHNLARGTFVEIDGKLQPAPAPRFSRTPAAVPTPPAEPGSDDGTALAAWGLSQGDIARLTRTGEHTHERT